MRVSGPIPAGRIELIQQFQSFGIKIVNGALVAYTWGSGENAVGLDAGEGVVGLKLADSGDWCKLIVVFDEAKRRLYQNGELKSKHTVSPQGTTELHHACPLTLFAEEGQFGDNQLFFASFVGLIRVWPRVLDHDTIMTRVSKGHSHTGGEAEDVWTLVQSAPSLEEMARRKDEEREKALHVAAETDDIEQVNSLVDSGTDVNATDFVLRTALHKAAGKSNALLVSRLIMLGARADMKDSYGLTPSDWAQSAQVKALIDTDSRLWCAARRGECETVVALLEEGVDRDGTWGDGTCALDQAAMHGHVHVVKQLLLKGARGVSKDAACAGMPVRLSGTVSSAQMPVRDHKSAIGALGAAHNARVKGTYERVDGLPHQRVEGLFVFAVHDHHETFLAGWKVHIDDGKERFTFVEARMHVNRFKPIDAASISSTWDNAGSKDPKDLGRTVLNGMNHECVLVSGITVVERVENVQTSMGVAKDEDIKSLLRNDALLEAARAGDASKVCALIEVGEVWNAHKVFHVGAHAVKHLLRDVALLEAAANGDAEMVYELVTMGADMTATNRDGDTALHVAVLRGHTECVLILVQGGADMTARNSAGVEIVDLAPDDNMKQVVARVLARSKEEVARIADTYSSLQMQSRAAARVCVSGAVKIERSDGSVARRADGNEENGTACDTVNGQYIKLPQLCNGRVCYSKVDNQEISLWCNSRWQSRWVIGPTRHMGTSVGYLAYLVDHSNVPEASSPAKINGKDVWKLRSGAGWQEQPNVKVEPYHTSHDEMERQRAPESGKFAASKLIFGHASDSDLLEKIGLEDFEILSACIRDPLRAMEDEWFRNSSDTDWANFNYVVHGRGRKDVPAHVRETFRIGVYHGGTICEADYDTGHDDMTLDDFCALEIARLAGLKPPHVVSIRLYTSDSYNLFNSFLRCADEKGQPHPIKTTIYFLNDAIKKLRKVVAKTNPHEYNQVIYLWRGIKNRVMDLEEFKKHGGTELATMSATGNKEIAMRYAAGDEGLLMSFATQGLSRGVQISEFSLYPHEKEFVYPPLTFLLLDRSREVTHEDGLTIVPILPQMA